jgi:hypothetical protein
VHFRAARGKSCVYAVYRGCILCIMTCGGNDKPHTHTIEGNILGFTARFTALSAWKIAHVELRHGFLAHIALIRMPILSLLKQNHADEP